MVSLLHIEVVGSVHGLLQQQLLGPGLRHIQGIVSNHQGRRQHQGQHRPHAPPGPAPLPAQAVAGNGQQILHGVLLSVVHGLPPAGHQLLHAQPQGGCQGLQQRHVRVAEAPLPLTDRLVGHVEPLRQLPLGQAQFPAPLANE